jgi:hypothetical protein
MMRISPANYLPNIGVRTVDKRANLVGQKPPTRLEISRQFLVRQYRTHHLDGNTVFLVNPIMIFTVLHLPGIDQFVMQCIELLRAD